MQPNVSTPVQKDTELIKNGKAQINNVGEVREHVVSGLEQPIDDSTFIAEYSKPRNMGFHTAVGNVGQTERTPSKRVYTTIRPSPMVKRCDFDCSKR